MSIRINNQTFPAEYMNTPEQTRQGMMGRDNLDGCMVFDMGAGTHAFHMKDTLIPLDIVFVMKGRISRIHPNCQPNSLEKYSGIADKVIEFPAGIANNFKVGDRVMYLGSPENPVKTEFQP
jgi:uncharacterized membrane protein (UPF0127 family)